NAGMFSACAVLISCDDTLAPPTATNFREPTREGCCFAI
ncbi:hypothetical protein D030_4228B, partial [Vibrio parahaemolyticus AQ3810]